MNLNEVMLDQLRDGRFDAWVWGLMPLAQPWLCRRPWRTPGWNHVWLIGQRGVEGCATVRQLRDGRLDVAVYDCTPEVVQGSRTELQAHLCTYKTVAVRPQWGLTVVMMIASELASGQALDSATHH